MVDLTPIGVAIAAKDAVKDIAGRVLGPTFDKLGGELRDLIFRENVESILDKAEKKGASLRKGQVPLRIVREIFTEGAVIEDELTAEYFGGVLASSKSEVSRDDRAISALKLIETLSAYQIRLHYLIYWYVRNFFSSQWKTKC